MNLKEQHCSSYQNEEYSSCRTAALWEVRSSRSFVSRGSWWWPTPVMWRWQYFQSQWYAVFKLSDRSIRIKRWRYWLGNFSMLASLVMKGKLRYWVYKKVSTVMMLFPRLTAGLVAIAAQGILLGRPVSHSINEDWMNAWNKSSPKQLYNHHDCFRQDKLGFGAFSWLRHLFLSSNPRMDIWPVVGNDAPKYKPVVCLILIPSDICSKSYLCIVNKISIVLLQDLIEWPTKHNR